MVFVEVTAVLVLDVLIQMHATMMVLRSMMDRVSSVALVVRRVVLIRLSMR